jgi:hypothetical protein
MPPPIDLTLYDRISRMLQARQLGHRQIAADCNVDVAVVARIYRGEIARPRQRKRRETPEESNTVAAAKFDRIMRYAESHPNATYKEVSKALKLGKYMVGDVISGRAKRGEGRKREAKVRKCKKCGRISPVWPCVLCRARAEAAKKPRAPRRDSVGELGFALLPPHEEARAKEWAEHLRAKRSEGREEAA